MSARRRVVVEVVVLLQGLPRNARKGSDTRACASLPHYRIKFYALGEHENLIARDHAQCRHFVHSVEALRRVVPELHYLKELHAQVCKGKITCYHLPVRYGD